MYIAGSGTPYWYEWEIGLIECLKMMSDTTVSSVVLQSEDFQSLDDVVVNYCDGSMINIQVKHSDIGENFTYSSLTSGALDKWAKEWQKEKNSVNIKEIRIVTNRSWGTNESDGKCSFDSFINKVLPKIQDDYSYQGASPKESTACTWFKTQVSHLGADAYDFIKILKFYKEEGDIGVDLKITDYVSRILGTDRKEAVDAANNSILAKLREWSTSRRSRQEIYREDIYNALCISSVDCPEYELYPEKPVFPSRVSFANLFLEQLKNNDKKVFFLQGLPGAGKTNFVSYLAQLDDSIVDFRFYTYLPVNKDYPSFTDDEGYYTGDFLWRSLLTQLKKYFEDQNVLFKLNFPLIYNYLSVTEMKEAVLNYLPEYAELVGRTCYVFIDGLDHAARSSNARNSFLAQLPLPNEISGNVKFILVGQPINDKYPHQLIGNSEIDYVSLPTLEESDIIMLLSKERICVSSIDLSSLAKSIIDVVGNNALNVLFAIREINRLQADQSFDSIISCLQEKKLNCQIDKYYEWMLSSITDQGTLLQKIKIIFAFASQKINAQHISEMCGEKLEDVVYILNKLYPLIECDSNEYYTFHNDVRLYLKESMIANSNFDALALSIYNKVLENEHLGQYKYDILFNIALELKNKQIVFDLYSPEYIVKSIQYKVSVNRLIQQFYTLAQLILESEDINNIDKICVAASTISQYINNIQYNEKEDLFYDERTRRLKTESEKYILSVEEKINDIVLDIYSLLKCNFIERASSVFDEYLKTASFDELMNGSNDESDLDYYYRCGYICRFFAPNILMNDSPIDKSLYIKFIKGWLEASSEFTGAKDIEITFCFKYYRSEFLNKYTSNICTKNALDSDAYYKLSRIYLSGDHMPISSLIDLCVYGILHKYEYKELQQAILSRQDEISTSHEFEFETDRIPYYIKSYFCLFTISRYIKGIPELYVKILKQGRVTPKDRGYSPAIDQFKLTQKICCDFYTNNQNCDEKIKVIYDTVYFEHQHGSGSSHDCNAYSVKTFLLNVLFYTHVDEASRDASKLPKICGGIKSMFLWENATYVHELTELFYIANAKEIYLSIVEHWCSAHGILWSKSYDEVEYIGLNIVHLLNQFGMTDEARKIEKIISFKLFGYVDHKDYSLSGVLDCYNRIPMSEEKLLLHGMKLLTISDNAYSIGDNRMASEVDRTLFEIAGDLGIKYIAALFELKNNPNDFYDWRRNFLEAYYQKISVADYPDDELVALHRIVNSWINEDIESNSRYGENQVEYLHQYNYRILEKIKDDELRKKILLLGQNSPPTISNADEYVVKSENRYEELIEDVRKNGYSQEIEHRIISTFSDEYGGQAKLLLDLRDTIDISRNRSFIKNCVIEYIIRKRKYGFRGAGLNEIIKYYYCNFEENDWISLLKHIIDSISATNFENFYNVNDDIETLCLYYYMGTRPDKLTELCSKKLDTHWCWLTSCGLLEMSPYKLSINDSIDSLKAFSEYQLGEK